MGMSKRDYTDLARAIYDGTDDTGERERIARMFVQTLRAGNSRFVPDMFVAAAMFNTTDPHTVVVNVPGYLPDDDGEPFIGSRRDAEGYARDIAREYRDEYGHGAVRGNARDGWYDIDNDTPLGVVVSIDRVQW